MGLQEAGLIGLQFEGSDETYWARPGPEDDGRLAELLRKGSASVALSGGEDDVEGHAESSELMLDVEGHAFTLRLPSPADAAALRRRLAVGAISATIVVAGAAAALQGAGNTLPAVDIPAAPAAPMVEQGSQRTINDPYMIDQAPDAAPAPVAPIVEQGASQRTINAPYMIDQVEPAAPAAPVAPIVEQGASQRTINAPYMIDQVDPAAPAAESAAGAGAAGSEDERSFPRAGEKPELR